MEIEGNFRGRGQTNRWHLAESHYSLLILDYFHKQNLFCIQLCTDWTTSFESACSTSCECLTNHVFFFSDYFSYQSHHHSYWHQRISSEPSMHLPGQALRASNISCIWLGWIPESTGGESLALNTSFFKWSFFIPKPASFFTSTKVCWVTPPCNRLVKLFLNI